MWAELNPSEIRLKYQKNHLFSVKIAEIVSHKITTGMLLIVENT
jgi:hypothetical protein